MKRVFITDCEGPISKNDNAFEASSRFIPNGDELFALVSKYDDVLADFVKKPGYNAGDTLKLILPFFKAYGVTDERLREFSDNKLVLIAGSKNTLGHVRSLAPSFIVSTSYEHYIKALCKALDFPFENTYCTRLSLDKYLLSEREKSRLRLLAEQIVQMPMIIIPPFAKSQDDFSEYDQKNIRRLDEIFWKEISAMNIGKIFKEVKPIGGSQKAEAIKEAAEKSHVQLSDVFYVGDSITDVEAFKIVRNNGGLTVSFNGNQYAVKNAEIAVMADNNIVIEVITELWCKLGKAETLEVLKNWSATTLRQSPLSRLVQERLFTLYPVMLPKLQIVTPQNMETLVRESSDFRKKVRGRIVGRLG